MYQIAYISQATVTQPEEKLKAILREARIFNSQHQITGLLLYKDCSFMQVLEGNEEQVSALYKRICNDRRHTNVVTLIKREIERRDFRNWAMACFNLDTDSEIEQGLKPFSLSAVLREVDRNKKIHKLIRHFMANA